MEKTARVVPGFRLNTWENLEFYFAAPMTFGSEDGYYYKNTITTGRSGAAIPFAFIFLVNVRGNVGFSTYK
jgi:hypothetical protein